MAIPIHPVRAPHDEDSGRVPSAAKVRIGPVLADNITSECAIAFIVERALRDDAESPAIVITLNAQSALLAADEPRFAAILNRGALCLADGMSIVFASRLLGTPLRQRITGVDLTETLCARCAREGLSVYFLGGRPGAADRTAAVLAARYPGLKIAGTGCPPQGFEHDPAGVERIRQRVREAAPDLLFVGFGVPKQEYWLDENAPYLETAVVMSVGGAFELLAGFVPRAPRWLQTIGMEWLFRLAMEPRRLWRRYLIGNTRFVLMIVRQLFAATAKD